MGDLFDEFMGGGGVGRCIPPSSDDFLPTLLYVVLQVRKSLDSYPIFQTVEDKTQVPKEYIVAGLVPVILLGLFIGGGMRLIRYVGFLFVLLMYSGLACVEGELMPVYAWHALLFSNLVGFLYPAYMSVAAIERTSNNKEASMQWYV